MTPEVFEGVRWVLVLVLGCFIIPLKKKMDCNQRDIAKIDKAQAVIDTQYAHIKESLEEIKAELKTMNGKGKK